MDKQTQDERWNELSEEYKEDHRHFYETYKDFAEETNFHTICRQLEKTFGSHNLNPKQIKTWEDVEKKYQYYNDQCESFCKHLYNDLIDDKKLRDKFIAAYKIAKLIELGYGGMITEEEWSSCDMIKYCIIRTDRFINYANIPNHYHFIAFHTPEQREEFMSYESNRQLVKQYHIV